VIFFPSFFWDQEKVLPPAESEEDDTGNGKKELPLFGRLVLGWVRVSTSRLAAPASERRRCREREGRELKRGSGFSMCRSGVRRRWFCGEGSVESGEADDDGGGGPGSGVENG